MLSFASRLRLEVKSVDSELSKLIIDENADVPDKVLALDATPDELKAVKWYRILVSADFFVACPFRQPRGWLEIRTGKLISPDGLCSVERDCIGRATVTCSGQPSARAAFIQSLRIAQMSTLFFDDDCDKAVTSWAVISYEGHTTLPHGVDISATKARVLDPIAAKKHHFTFLRGTHTSLTLKFESPQVWPANIPVEIRVDTRGKVAVKAHNAKAASQVFYRLASMVSRIVAAPVAAAASEVLVEAAASEVLVEAHVAHPGLQLGIEAFPEDVGKERYDAVSLVTLTPRAPRGRRVAIRRQAIPARMEAAAEPTIPSASMSTTSSSAPSVSKTKPLARHPKTNTFQAEAELTAIRNDLEKERARVQNNRIQDMKRRQATAAVRGLSMPQAKLAPPPPVASGLWDWERRTGIASSAIASGTVIASSETAPGDAAKLWLAKDSCVENTAGLANVFLNRYNQLETLRDIKSGANLAKGLVAIGDSKIPGAGQGVFALGGLASKQQVGSYCGGLISKSEYDRRAEEKDTTSFEYVLEIDKNVSKVHKLPYSIFIDGLLYDARLGARISQFIAPLKIPAVITAEEFDLLNAAHDGSGATNLEGRIAAFVALDKMYGARELALSKIIDALVPRVASVNNGGALKTIATFQSLKPTNHRRLLREYIRYLAARIGVLAEPIHWSTKINHKWAVGDIATRANVKFAERGEIVALRDIVEGEELYIDYSTAYWIHRWTGMEVPDRKLTRADMGHLTAIYTSLAKRVSVPPQLATRFKNAPLSKTAGEDMRIIIDELARAVLPN